MKKKLLIVSLICFIIALGTASFIFAATYDEYVKEDKQLKVGTVYYKKYTLKKLLREKVEIEIDYADATQRYNKAISKINALIVEAGKLGVAAVQ